MTEITNSYENQARELENLITINQVASQLADWRLALDQIVQLARAILIFDNLVCYLPDIETGALEVVYARAVGRGRSAGADLSWGESIASQVLVTKQIFIQEPQYQPGANDRLDQPHVLGVPMKIQDQLKGILVLIRFGGPTYDQHDNRIASFVAEEFTNLLERKQLMQKFASLEAEQQQARLQEDFITTISHELLTPLGFIKGYATTLLRSDTTWDEKNRREFLTIIDQETDRLQELIDNLLDSARLQSGTMPMEFQPVRLDALIRDVIMRTRLQHKSLQVLVKMDSPITPIRGDPRRLAQVFENLISNALKYAPGAAINVTLRRDKDYMYISFHDSGPGIPQQYQGHLFERFYRNPEQAINVRGSGLGLYICRQIITTHNGRIWIESLPSEGTNVQILLPVDQPDHLPGTAKPGRRGFHR
jgi:K+-sensing histidine kinase KdpD